MRKHPLPDSFLSAPQVREYFGITGVTLWRWERQAGLNFPVALRINGRRYWHLSALRAFEAARAVADSPRPVSPNPHLKAKAQAAPEFSPAG